MFSEKYGYKPEKSILLDSVTDTLRIRVWNLFYQNEIQAGGLSSPRIQLAFSGGLTVEDKIADKLGFPAGSAKKNGPAHAQIEKYLIQDCQWYEVYDFIEIHLSSIEDDENKSERIKQYNDLLEYEKSGYRVVAGEVAPITNPSEIEAIEEAAQTPFESVNQHIRKAVEKYADIESPDYENSIKESISAVEAMCCIITGQNGANATLGKTIKKLKDNGVHIHPGMENAFSALYGYTSDEGGIRHGGIDFINAPAEDAKYMLINCSAFVNYLIEKWSKLQDSCHASGEVQ